MGAPRAGPSERRRGSAAVEAARAGGGRAPRLRRRAPMASKPRLRVACVSGLGNARGDPRQRAADARDGGGGRHRNGPVRPSALPARQRAGPGARRASPTGKAPAGALARPRRADRRQAVRIAPQPQFTAAPARPGPSPRPGTPACRAKTPTAGTPQPGRQVTDKARRDGRRHHPRLRAAPATGEHASRPKARRRSPPDRPRSRRAPRPNRRSRSDGRGEGDRDPPDVQLTR